MTTTPLEVQPWTIGATTKSRRQFFTAEDFKNGVRAEQQEDNDQTVGKTPNLEQAERTAEKLWEAD